MIVDTEKVLREADGSVKLVVVRPAHGVRLESWTGEPVRSPKITSVNQWMISNLRVL